MPMLSDAEALELAQRHLAEWSKDKTDFDGVRQTMVELGQAAIIHKEEIGQPHPHLTEDNTLDVDELYHSARLVANEETRTRAIEERRREPAAVTIRRSVSQIKRMGDTPPQKSVREYTPPEHRRDPGESARATVLRSMREVAERE
jgi:hypothetical protein